MKRTHSRRRLSRKNIPKIKRRRSRSSRRSTSRRSRRRTTRRRSRRSPSRRVKAGSGSPFVDESKVSSSSESSKEDDNMVKSSDIGEKLQFELIDYEYSDGKKGVNKVLSGRSLNSKEFTLRVISGDQEKDSPDIEKFNRLELKNSNANITIKLYRPFIQRLKEREMYKIFDTAMEPPIQNYIEVKAADFPVDYSYPANYDDNPRLFIN